MTPNHLICPLCDGPAQLPNPHEIPNRTISCPRCAEFVLYEDMILALHGQTVPDKHQLSGYAREQNVRGNQSAEFQIRDLDAYRNYAPQTVQEQSDRLLTSLALLTKSGGKWHKLKEHVDYPLAYSPDAGGLRYFVTYLATNGLILVMDSGLEMDCQLTVEGWNRVDKLRKPNRESVKAFMALAFADDMKPVYDAAIYPAVAESGYVPLRIDAKEYLGEVMDEVIGEIRESRFIVADLTHHRNGVYFEAGFALGLGLPVIWTCSKGHIKKAHFDVKHLAMIDWKSPEELRDRLSKRIRAVIGKSRLARA